MDRPLRIMSFNVNGTAGDGPNAWPKRRDLNVRTILRHRPDVLGLQEVAPANLAEYAATLSGYGHVPGIAYGDLLPTDTLPIFWRDDRFDLEAHGHVWFSDSPDVPSSGWGVPYPMGATWVRLRSSAPDARFLVVNTHFEDGPGGERSRREASRLLVERFALPGGGPVVLLGDFNCAPWSEAYLTLTGAGFVDTHLAAGHADSLHTGTFHGFEGERYFALDWGDEMSWRVDWILVRDGDQRLRATAASIVHDGDGATFPSDHFPVLADVRMRAE